MAGGRYEISRTAVEEPPLGGFFFSFAFFAQFGRDIVNLSGTP
jgi:hypothetical protein